MASMIGRTLGRYRITGLLGEGGMATVYRAYDERLEREVAIKIIRRDAFPAEQLEMMLKRFEREAKALANLSHPNIVGIMDYGEYEGVPYIVMVCLPGGTLKQRLVHPMPWRDALKMLIPIAHALQYAHEHNIINRDIKPSNILLTEKGQPMLTDFGLVKLFQGEKTHLTASGSGMGTPDYMAPEQWVGETSPKSDIYSLGIVLYEMITDHRPYTADTPAGILLKQATEPLAPPHYHVHDIPDDVEKILLKALEKNPQDRYEDMHAFATAMEDLLIKQSIPVPAAVPKAQVKLAQTIPPGRQPPQKVEVQTTPKKRSSPTLVWKIVIGLLILLILCIAIIVAAYFYAHSQNIGGFFHTPTVTSTAAPPATASPRPKPTSSPTNIASPTVTPTLSPTATPTDVPPTKRKGGKDDEGGGGGGGGEPGGGGGGGPGGG
jgi:serine/threonine protein kinase